MRRRFVSLISFAACVTLIAAVTTLERPTASTRLASATSWTGSSSSPSSPSALRQGANAPGATDSSTRHITTSRASVTSASTGQTSISPATSACTPWSVTTNQSPLDPILYSDAALSATNVWAVGTYYNINVPANRTLVEHFNGSTWSVVSSPSSGTIDNRLQRVTAISPNDIWAVGEWQNLSEYYRTLAEHWDGTKWSIISTPNEIAPTTANNDLTGISAVSSTDVWAVGSTSGLNQNPPIVEHWNGSTWSLVTVPMPNTILPSLTDVVAISSNDVWLVGSYFTTGSGVSGPLFAHWNGANWTVDATTTNGWYSGYLNRVVALSNSDIWAVGYGFPTSSSNMETLTEHWNGSTWSLVSSPNPGGFPVSLNDVVAVSPNDVWAVGDMSQYAPIYRLPVALHWDGRAWSVVTTPPTNTYSIFSGVAAVAPENVFAVGEYILNPQPGVASKAGARTAATQTNEYLIERYNPLVMTACK